MKKKLIFSLLLDIGCVVCIIMNIDKINSNAQYIQTLKLNFGEALEYPMFKYYALDIISCSISTLVCLSVLIYFVLYFIKHLKGSNASNFVRYTYEEYKAYIAKKKEEKQAKKRAKLQAQRQRLDAELQEMEKTE